MQRFIFLIFAAGVLSGCTNGNSTYDPSALTESQQKEFIWRIIRYAAKSPEGVAPAERFFSQYDSFYVEQANRYRLDAYLRTGERQYFLISRPAPSLQEKRVATGGFVELDDQGVKDYREIFRTWKMVPDTLSRRSLILFTKMVEGESLEQYEARYTGKDDYIEFPDDRIWYDTVNRIWALRPVILN